jgi:iron-sulfur cluster assembly 1
LRTFASAGARRQSSKRELYTAPAYQPHTLPNDFPLPPRNSGIPETSIASPRPQRRPDAPQEPPKKEAVSEIDAQQPQPVPEQKPVSKAAKPRRSKLKPRKAAMKISSTAVEHLRELLDQPEPQMIRVGVKNRGCSGLAYHLEYVEKPGTFDEVVEQDGVKVLIDSKALFSIIGSEMDWLEDKLSARFVFKNPNITEQCGCGESFSVS